MLIDDNTGTSNMTEIKSYQNYIVDGNPWVDEDRPSLGSAPLVVMGVIIPWMGSHPRAAGCNISLKTQRWAIGHCSVR
jgi:hypothetical protein